MTKLKKHSLMRKIKIYKEKETWRGKDITNCVNCYTVYWLDPFNIKVENWRSKEFSLLEQALEWGFNHKTKGFPLPYIFKRTEERTYFSPNEAVEMVKITAMK